jgi:hypothetical protein
LLAVAGLHLAVLWVLGVAQPLFDLLGDNATFFVVRGSEPVDIVLFAVGLVTVPPAALLIVEAVAGLLSTSLRAWLHVAFVGLLIALIALQLLKDLIVGGSSGLLIPLALAVGAGGALAYARAEAVRSALTVLSPAPAVFVVLFLFFSPVSKLVTGGEATAALADVRARTPVILLVLDEFPVTALMRPDQSIDAGRYPHFAALARHSTWFTRTVTVHPQSEYAVPAVLTGRWPRAGKLPILADHPRNIFTLLGGAYDVEASESLTRLCPPELCRRRKESAGERLRSLASDLSVVSLHLLLPDDLGERLPSISTSWQDFRGGPSIPPSVDREQERKRGAKRILAAYGNLDRAATAASFVSSIGRSDVAGRPPFRFMHILLPHTPWEYLPSGRRYGNPRLSVGQGGSWSSDSSAAERGYQRHLLQVGYVDWLIGRMLRRLRATGMYDRSLVVVTADHGASFHAGEPFRTLNATTESDIAFVPLFVKEPGQRAGRVVDTPAQTIDVLPTIADAAGIALPWKVDGHSLLADTPARRELRIYTPIVTEREVYPLERLEAGLEDELRRKADLFGTGTFGSRLFRIGPHHDLLGRLAATLPRSSAADVSATIDDPELLATVDPATGFVPVHVTGTVRSDGPRDLAIAVNGRIRALTRSLPSAGANRYSAMVPEGILRRGRNEVEVFAVSEAPLRLTSVARTRAASYTLETDSVGLPGGRRVALVGGRIDGFLGGPSGSGPEIEVRGWAAAGKRPVDRVLLFSGRRFLVAARPTIARPDVADYLHTDADRLGFSITVPYYALESRRPELSAVALAGGVAARLKPLCKPPDPRVAGC